MYIYHALINALSAHTIHINLNMILYIYTRRAQSYQNNLHKVLDADTHTHILSLYLTHTHTHTHARARARSRNWVLTLVGAKYCEKRKVFSLALKDDRVEQCLRSCGSEIQMWGPKQKLWQNSTDF